MESYNDTFSLPKQTGELISTIFGCSSCMHACTSLTYSIIECIIIILTACHAFTELTARLVSEAFYNSELESEVRLLVAEKKLTLNECIFRQDADRNNIMEKIESIRSHSIYPHYKCTAECKERGTYGTIIIIM